MDKKIAIYVIVRRALGPEKIQSERESEGE